MKIEEKKIPKEDEKKRDAHRTESTERKKETLKLHWQREENAKRKSPFRSFISVVFTGDERNEAVICVIFFSSSLACETNELKLNWILVTCNDSGCLGTSRRVFEHMTMTCSESCRVIDVARACTCLDRSMVCQPSRFRILYWVGLVPYVTFDAAKIVAVNILELYKLQHPIPTFVWHSKWMNVNHMNATTIMRLPNQCDFCHFVYVCLCVRFSSSFPLLSNFVRLKTDGTGISRSNARLLKATFQLLNDRLYTSRNERHRHRQIKSQ